MIKNERLLTTSIETRWIGPLLFKRMHRFDLLDQNVSFEAPLATYETTLFYSVARGARAIASAGGLISTLVADTMTRSIVLEAEDAHAAQKISQFVKNNIPAMQEEIVSKQSRFAKLQKVDVHVVANLIYLRFSLNTDNAAGHNMVTLVSDHLIDFITREFPSAQYVSLSGNMCVDKKVSMINALEGRGKHIISEIVIPREVVAQVLKTTPEKIVNLNIKKNLLGSIMAGSIHSANAHYANMLLAFYLATGQDAANIVEGSQGITHAEVREGDLYFSVTLPNIIVGSIGHGKHHPEIQDALERMNCLHSGGSQKLAHICAGIVLAGELSLMAALTNQKELMKAHVGIERKNNG
jgi:hydroxymethylglutaryl-CoA reductase (NADPH)